MNHQSQAGLLAERLEIAGEFGGEGREVDGLVASLSPPGLDAGEIEHRIDELQKPQRVAVRNGETRGSPHAGACRGC